MLVLPEEVNWLRRAESETFRLFSLLLEAASPPSGKLFTNPIISHPVEYAPLIIDKERDKQIAKYVDYEPICAISNLEFDYEICITSWATNLSSSGPFLHPEFSSTIWTPNLYFNHFRQKIEVSITGTTF